DLGIRICVEVIKAKSPYVRAKIQHADKLDPRYYIFSRLNRTTLLRLTILRTTHSAPRRRIKVTRNKEAPTLGWSGPLARLQIGCARSFDCNGRPQPGQTKF